MSRVRYLQFLGVIVKLMECSCATLRTHAITTENPKEKCWSLFNFTRLGGCAFRYMEFIL